MTGVFEGIRVADFSWVGVGPIATKYLADQGAEVIRVESSKRPDVLRLFPPMVDDVFDIDTAGYYANFNSSKLGATLNFEHPRARELALRLIAKCDVVAESFRPGVMERFGLQHEEVCAERPDLIWIRMPMFGASGPWGDRGGYGNTLQALAGVHHLLGRRDGEPLGSNTAFTDFFATHFAALALVAALAHRAQTGHGQYIEVSQMEASMYLLGPLTLVPQVLGEDPIRDENRHPDAVPHNAYPCLGDDRWVAITCFCDEEWQALVDEMGCPGWAIDPTLGTLEGRKSAEARVDGGVTAWTRNYPPEEVMHRLQRRGVPAAVVANLEDLHKDAQLAYREHYRYLDHPKMGRRSYDAPAFRLSETPERLSRPAPTLGQHNDYVWRELVGLGEDELAGLIVEGVLE